MANLWFVNIGREVKKVFNIVVYQPTWERKKIKISFIYVSEEENFDDKCICTCFIFSNVIEIKYIKKRLLRWYYISFVRIIKLLRKLQR